MQAHLPQSTSQTNTQSLALLLTPILQPELKLQNDSIESLISTFSLQSEESGDRMEKRKEQFSLEKGNLQTCYYNYL